MQRVRLEFNSRGARETYVDENWKECKYRREWRSKSKGTYWLEYFKSQ